jgi:ABC-type multidrug transport system fused ATPase/permease subunit
LLTSVGILSEGFIALKRLHLFLQRNEIQSTAAIISAHITIDTGSNDNDNDSNYLKKRQGTENFVKVESDEHKTKDNYNDTEDGENNLATSVYDIILRGVSFRWNAYDTQAALSNINFAIKRGELIGVVGFVGSGKLNIYSKRT